MVVGGLVLRWVVSVGLLFVVCGVSLVVLVFGLDFGVWLRWGVLRCLLVWWLVFVFVASDYCGLCISVDLLVCWCVDGCRLDVLF